MEKTAIEKLNNLWTATTLNGRLRTGRNRNRKKNRNGNGYGTHNTNREPTWAGQRSHISWLNLILITLNLIIQKERKILPQKLTYLYVEIFIVATSCKNVETHPWKNDLWCCKLLVVSGLWDIILTSLLKVVPLSFEYGLLLLATLIRGGGGITSTRSWTGYLCQNTVQCLKYFCNWLWLQ